MPVVGSVLVVVPPAPSLYKDASRRVHAIFRRLAAPEKIESVSLDEAYLDVTTRTRTSSAEELARRIKFLIHTEV